ncbi:MAG: hypothetical protein MUF36_00080 [Bacteroidales bacterium]|jgi:hypothetical protein|nr:hypothetical protein [Bacteroidales bacterium]
MEKIDKIVFGDNQFFGINHMSQEKAQQLSEKFRDLNRIIEIYDIALGLGINSIMLNSNDRAREICNYFRNNASRYSDIKWYPSIPYPHKYANLVAEKGIVQTINELVFKGNTVSDILGMISKGGAVLFNKDVIKIMKLLIDLEMRIFEGLDIKVVFLQNIITDLILGFSISEVFKEYCNYIRKRYKAIPGLITQNMPYLLDKLNEWGIDNVVICSSFNKIGYLMSPDINSYVLASKNNNPEKIQIMAMSTLASGAIPPNAAYEFINRQNIQSVVFGASSERNIEETMSLIKL